MKFTVAAVNSSDNDEEKEEKQGIQEEVNNATKQQSCQINL